MISHTNMFLNAKNAMLSMKSILEDNGWTVELNKTTFKNTSTKKEKYCCIEFDNIDTMNVEEMINSELYLSLYIRHFYDDDSELLGFISEINDYFEDYTLNGNVKKCRYFSSENYVQDSSNKKFYFVQTFLVEI